MQTTQKTFGQTGESGFQPIPTRITDVPPLIVEREQSQIDQQVTGYLESLGERVAQIHRAAAEAYISQGQYAHALPHAEAAATFAPTITEYHNQLGFLRYIQGDDSGAVTCFEQVLSLQPNQPDALFNLGMVRFGQGDLQQAEECFRRCLELQPDNAETWNNRGVCLHQLGRIAEARTCFERTLQIEPANQDARANLAAIGA